MALYNIDFRVKLNGPASADLNKIKTDVENQLKFNGKIDVKFDSSVSTGINQLNKSLQQLNNTLQQVQATAAKTGSSVTASLGATSTAASNVNQLNRSVTSSVPALNNYAAGFKSVGQEAFLFGEQIGLATRRFAAFSIGAGAAIGALAGIGAGIKEAVSFQNELVRFSQVSGDLKGDIQGIATEVGTLARRYGVSSTEIVQSAVNLRQAGYTAREVKLSLETLAQAAASPNFDSFTRNTEAAIAVMHQFRIPVEDLNRAFSSINAVAAEFAVSAKDIQEGVTRAGGAFSSAGGNLNQFIALFTSVKATTQESADAVATGLRTIFTRLQRQDTIDALRALGVQLRYTRDEAIALGEVNLTNQFVKPYEAVQRIAQTLRSIPSTDPRYEQITETIGGSRQFSRTLPLLQRDDIQKRALDIANNSGGNLGFVADKAQESLSRRVTSVTENFKELFRVITSSSSFDSLARVFLKMGDYLANILKFATPLLPLLTAFSALKVFQTFQSGAVNQAVSGFATKLFNPRADIGYPYQNRSFASGGFASSGPARIMSGEAIVPQHLMSSGLGQHLTKLNSGGTSPFSAYTPPSDRISYVPGDTSVTDDNIYANLPNSYVLRKSVAQKPEVKRMLSGYSTGGDKHTTNNGINEELEALLFLYGYNESGTINSSFSDKGKYLSSPQKASKVRGKLLNESVLNNTFTRDVRLYRTIPDRAFEKVQLTNNIDFRKDKPGGIVDALSIGLNSTTPDLDFAKKFKEDRKSTNPIFSILASRGQPGLQIDDYLPPYYKTKGLGEETLLPYKSKFLNLGYDEENDLINLKYLGQKVPGKKELSRLLGGFATGGNKDPRDLSEFEKRWKNVDPTTLNDSELAFYLDIFKGQLPPGAEKLINERNDNRARGLYLDEQRGNPLAKPFVPFRFKYTGSLSGNLGPAGLPNPYGENLPGATPNLNFDGTPKPVPVPSPTPTAPPKPNVPQYKSDALDVLKKYGDPLGIDLTPLYLSDQKSLDTYQRRNYRAGTTQQADRYFDEDVLKYTGIFSFINETAKVKRPHSSLLTEQALEKIHDDKLLFLYGKNKTYDNYSKVNYDYDSFNYTNRVGYNQSQDKYFREDIVSRMFSEALGFDTQTFVPSAFNDGTNIAGALSADKFRYRRALQELYPKKASGGLASFAFGGNRQLELAKNPISDSGFASFLKTASSPVFREGEPVDFYKLFREYIEQGAIPLNSGAAASALLQPSGQVLRAQPDVHEEDIGRLLSGSSNNVFRPNIQGVLQNTGSKLLDNSLFLEQLPFVKIAHKEYISGNKTSKENYDAGNYLQKLLLAQGYYHDDFHMENFGYLGSGKNEEPVITDVGHLIDVRTRSPKDLESIIKEVGINRNNKFVTPPLGRFQGFATGGNKILPQDNPFSFKEFDKKFGNDLPTYQHANEAFLKYIPKDAEFLGKGSFALAFREQSGDVLRIQPEINPAQNQLLQLSNKDALNSFNVLENYIRPQSDDVLQAKASLILPNFRTGLGRNGSLYSHSNLIERVPYAPSIFDTKGTVNIGGKTRMNVNSQDAQHLVGLSERLAYQGLGNVDLNYTNVGQHDGRYKVTDPGGLFRKLPEEPTIVPKGLLFNPALKGSNEPTDLEDFLKILPTTARQFSGNLGRFATGRLFNRPNVEFDDIKNPIFNRDDIYEYLDSYSQQSNFLTGNKPLDFSRFVSGIKVHNKINANRPQDVANYNPEEASVNFYYPNFRNDYLGNRDVSPRKLLAHEVGHAFDYRLTGAAGSFGFEGNRPAPFSYTDEFSGIYKSLKPLIKTVDSPIATFGSKDFELQLEEQKRVNKYNDYLKNPQEVFAELFAETVGNSRRFQDTRHPAVKNGIAFLKQDLFKRAQGFSSGGSANLPKFTFGSIFKQLVGLAVNPFREDSNIIEQISEVFRGKRTLATGVEEIAKPEPVNISHEIEALSRQDIQKVGKGQGKVSLADGADQLYMDEIVKTSKDAYKKKALETFSNFEQYGVDKGNLFGTDLSNVPLLRKELLDNPNKIDDLIKELEQTAFLASKGNFDTDGKFLLLKKQQLIALKAQSRIPEGTDDVQVLHDNFGKPGQKDISKRILKDMYQSGVSEEEILKIAQEKFQIKESTAKKYFGEVKKEDYQSLLAQGLSEEAAKSGYAAPDFEGISKGKDGKKSIELTPENLNPELSKLLAQIKKGKRLASGGLGDVPNARIMSGEAIIPRAFFGDFGGLAGLNRLNASGQTDHLSKGGLTSKERVVVAEQGEYIVNKNVVDAYGPAAFERLNRTGQADGFGGASPRRFHSGGYLPKLAGGAYYGKSLPNDFTKQEVEIFEKLLDANKDSSKMSKQELVDKIIDEIKKVRPQPQIPTKQPSLEDVLYPPSFEESEIPEVPDFNKLPKTKKNSKKYKKDFKPDPSFNPKIKETLPLSPNDLSQQSAQQDNYNPSFSPSNIPDSLSQDEQEQYKLKGPSSKVGGPKTGKGSKEYAETNSPQIPSGNLNPDYNKYAKDGGPTLDIDIPYEKKKKTNYNAPSYKVGGPPSGPGEGSIIIPPELPPEGPLVPPSLKKTGHLGTTTKIPYANKPLEGSAFPDTAVSPTRGLEFVLKNQNELEQAIKKQVESAGKFARESDKTSTIQERLNQLKLKTIQYEENAAKLASAVIRKKELESGQIDASNSLEYKQSLATINELSQSQKRLKSEVTLKRNSKGEFEAPLFENEEAPAKKGFLGKAKDLLSGNGGSALNIQVAAATVAGAASYGGSFISQYAGNASEALEGNRQTSYVVGKGLQGAVTYGSLGASLGTAVGGPGIGTAVGAGVGVVYGASAGATEAIRDLELAKFRNEIEKSTKAFNALASSAERLQGRFTDTDIASLRGITQRGFTEASGEYSRTAQLTPGSVTSLFTNLISGVAPARFAFNTVSELSDGQSVGSAARRAFAYTAPDFLANRLPGQNSQQVLDSTESITQRQSRLLGISRQQPQVLSQTNRALEAFITNLVQRSDRPDNDTIVREIRRNFGNDEGFQALAVQNGFGFGEKVKNGFGETEFTNSRALAISPILAAQINAIRRENVGAGTVNRTGELEYGFGRLATQLTHASLALQDFTHSTAATTGLVLGGTQLSNRRDFSEELARPLDTRTYRQALSNVSNTIGGQAGDQVNEVGLLVGRLSSLAPEILNRYVRGTGSLLPAENDLATTQGRASGSFISELGAATQVRPGTASSSILQQFSDSLLATFSGKKAELIANPQLAENTTREILNKYTTSYVQIAQQITAVNNQIIAGEQQILNLKLRQVDYAGKGAELNKESTILRLQQQATTQYGNPNLYVNNISERQFNSPFYSRVDSLGRGNGFDSNTSVTDLVQRGRTLRAEIDRRQSSGTSASPQQSQELLRLEGNFVAINQALQLYINSTNRMILAQEQLALLNRDRASRVEGQRRLYTGTDEDRTELFQGRIFAESTGLFNSQRTPEQRAASFRDLGQDGRGTLDSYVRTFADTLIAPGVTLGARYNELLDSTLPPEVRQRSNAEIARLNEQTQAPIQQALEANQGLSDIGEAQIVSTQQRLQTQNTTALETLTTSVNQLNALFGRDELQRVNNRVANNFSSGQLDSISGQARNIGLDVNSLSGYSPTQLTGLANTIGYGPDQSDLSEFINSLAEPPPLLNQGQPLLNPGTTRPLVPNPDTYQIVASLLERYASAHFYGFATGGPVYANNGFDPSIFRPQGTDTIPAMLSPGEFVINAQSTKANYALLEKINSERRPISPSNNGFGINGLTTNNLNSGNTLGLNSVNRANGGVVYAQNGLNVGGLPLNQFQFNPRVPRPDPNNPGEFLQNDEVPVINVNQQNNIRDLEENLRRLQFEFNRERDEGRSAVIRQQIDTLTNALVRERNGRLFPTDPIPRFDRAGVIPEERQGPIARARALREFAERFRRPGLNNEERAQADRDAVAQAEQNLNNSNFNILARNPNNTAFFAQGVQRAANAPSGVQEELMGNLARDFQTAQTTNAYYERILATNTLGGQSAQFGRQQNSQFEAQTQAERFKFFKQRSSSNPRLNPFSYLQDRQTPFTRPDPRRFENGGVAYLAEGGHPLARLYNYFRGPTPEQTRLESLRSEIESNSAQVTQAAEEDRLQALYAEIERNSNRSIRTRAANKQVSGYNSGGHVIGPSGGDVIPAYLSNGEYVLNSRATSNIGVGNLDRINRFANGGAVGSNQGSGVGLGLGFDTSELQKAMLTFNAENSKLNEALLGFGPNASGLADALNNFPRNIQMTGQHQVEVLINGSAALENMMPAIRELVDEEIAKSIKELIKTKFVDYA